MSDLTHLVSAACMTSGSKVLSSKSSQRSGGPWFGDLCQADIQPETAAHLALNLNGHRRIDGNLGGLFSVHGFRFCRVLCDQVAQLSAECCFGLRIVGDGAISLEILVGSGLI